MERDNFTCQYCGLKAPNVELHVEHIIPVSEGGTNDELNLIASCSDCNLGKSTEELTKDEILSLQKEIIERMKEQVHKEDKKMVEECPEYFYERPTKELWGNKGYGIVEPLKHVTMNPYDDFLLRINIPYNVEDALSLDVIKGKVKGTELKWKCISSKKLDAIFTSKMNALFDDSTAETSEYAWMETKVNVMRNEKGFIAVFVYRNKEWKSHLIWCPLKDISVDVEFLQNKEIEEGMIF